MSIPVKIEMGEHVVLAVMHVLPRAGEKLRCAFHAAGINEHLHLVVTNVTHQQVGTPDGQEDGEPFLVVVTVMGDPAEKDANDLVLARASKRRE